MRRASLTLESLADRVTPAAFDLAIDGDAVTANVSTSLVGNTTTFTSTGPGAILSVADLAAALAAGDVVVTTGTAGGGAGNILWDSTSSLDDLTFSGTNSPTLTFRPSVDSTTGGVYVGTHLDFQNHVTLVIDTTQPATDGNITIGGVNNAAAVNLSAGTGMILPGGISAAGSILATAAILSFNSAGLVGDTVTVNGNSVCNYALGGLNLVGTTSVTVNGTIDGYGYYEFDAPHVALNGTLGGTTPLSQLMIYKSAVTAGDIHSSVIIVGSSTVGAPPASLSASAITTTTLAVGNSGKLAPGGFGTAGNLVITGSVQFGGTLALDLGATTDSVSVTGNLQLQSGAVLGGAGSTGQLPSDGLERTVLTVGGSRTGTFSNAAAIGAIFAVGGDLLELTDYGPPDIKVKKVVPTGTTTGTDADGTSYAIKLNGPGQVLQFPGAGGGIQLLVQNTTSKSVVTVTTRANSSNDTIDFEGVTIAGPLGKFVGKKANITGDFVANGPVTSIEVRDLDALTIGGAATDKTSVKLANGLGDVQVPGVLTLTATGNFNGGIKAASVASAKFGGLLKAGSPWDVTGPIATLSAAEIQDVTIQAASVGALKTTGAGGLSGDIANSQFNLSGAGGLKTLTAKGSVRTSVFNISGGDVRSFTVGRFIDSQLYVRYTPGADFLEGTFTGEGFIGKFTTTAKVFGDDAHPLNYAFSGSQVAASTLGTVRLTGLRTANGGTPSGFKFATAGGSIQTTAADSVSILLKKNLNPDLNGPLPPTAVNADFYYFDASPAP